LSYVLEKNGLGEDEALKFFIQLISAMKYCHDRSIIHRDIKHQNILLDDKFNMKLIDFGLSNYMEEGKLRSTFCGTPAYAAPEMIIGKKIQRSRSRHLVHGSCFVFYDHRSFSF